MTTSDLREQHLQAWTERRAGETRAMLSSSDGSAVWHEWLGDGRCIACGRMHPRLADVPTTLLRIASNRLAAAQETIR